MKYAILLVLDKASQTKIGKVRKCLANNGIAQDAFKLNHITITVFDADDEGKVVEVSRKFANDQKFFTTTLSSVSAFITEKNVVFYAPVVTKELKAVHEKYLEKMSKNFRNMEHYWCPEKWVPHCTLADGITDSAMLKAFEILKQNNILPLDVVVDGLCVLQIDSRLYKRVAEFELKSKGIVDREHRVFFKG
ncbi:MAG: 2'-5' RNA ligase family protein [Endomicrobia bacterium]|nr:2'-5' RNA ligase family protein [Endomicrobiia bacterium]